MEFDWRVAVAEASERFGTPTYLFCWPLVLEALDSLKAIEQTIPVRHWLSLKSQPIGRLLREWKHVGKGVEVVSEFELQAALHEGYPPEAILVNGVAKHRWLDRSGVEGIRVHFDSLQELHQLVDTAAKRAWRVGIRCAVKGQVDSDDPRYSGQFGLSGEEVFKAQEYASSAKIEFESVHFHLRSNIADEHEYEGALSDLIRICRNANLRPKYLDCGGGLPCPGDDILKGGTFDFNLPALGRVMAQAAQQMGSVEEIWLENGRFLSGRAGVLVLTIIDIKNRPEGRYIICDGGRTNHALVSDWETHRVLTMPERSGPLVHSTICGPTCMSFDRLRRMDLPEDIEIGDLLLWFNAGAYHLPWETRFSHGLAPVVWIDAAGNMVLARNRETFSEWWDRWC